MDTFGAPYKEQKRSSQSAVERAAARDCRSVPARGYPKYRSHLTGALRVVGRYKRAVIHHIPGHRDDQHRRANRAVSPLSPGNMEAIRVSNASRHAPLVRSGRGIVHSLAWAPDGKMRAFPMHL